MGFLLSRHPVKPLCAVWRITRTGPLLGLACLLASVWASAGFSGKRLTEQITTRQGLSQSAVNCVLQDRFGYLWIGTQDGLNRYDGVRFLVFTHDPLDSQSISDSYITTLFEDRQGRLWVGTQEGGLNLYDRRTGHFTRYRHDPANSNSLGSNGVLAIRQDKPGMLWLGTWGGGLSRLDTASGRFTNYRHDPADPDSLSNNNVWSVCIDRQGVVWAGTYHGLNRLDSASRNGKFTRFQAVPSDPAALPSGNITALLDDPEGKLWIATWGGGLAMLGPDRRTFRTWRHLPDDPASLSDDRVWSLARDSGGHLWAGTGSAGVCMFDGQRFFRYLQSGEHGLTSNHTAGIQGLTADRTGIVWAGSQGSGLFKILPPLKSFDRYAHSDEDPASLRGNNVWALCEDQRGTVWAGTLGSGLNRLDEQSGRFIQYHPDGKAELHLPDLNIFSIHEDPAGRLWIGTQEQGLWLIGPDGGRPQPFPAKSTELHGTRLLALLAGPDGVLWIGTMGKGLFRLDIQHSTLTRFTAVADRPEGLSSNAIFSLCRTRNGTLWIGTMAEGLDCYRDGKFYHYRHDPARPESLRDNRILCLREDRNGHLWIGTWGGGLCRLEKDGQTFTTFTEKDGLPNNTIYGILEDEEGNLWLSTNRGICRFNPATGATRSYSSPDGLLDDELNQGAFCQGRSGRLYFGGSNGFTAFHPGQIRDNPLQPPVVLTAFRRFGTLASRPDEITDGSALKLGYQENFFTIEFAALDFLAPAKNRYRYKLENLDLDWSPASYHPFSSYTNVPPGDYIFRVQASNSDGIWNETGTTLPVHIAPPWWRTWWAYCVFAGMMAGCLFLFIGSRNRRHRRELSAQREELEKERIASETLRRAEAALRESEERFKQFMSNFPGIGFIKDTGSRAVFVNKEFEKLFGVRNQDIAGKRDEETWPPEVCVQFREVDQQVVREKRPVEWQDEIPFPGGLRYFQTTKFPIFGARGEVAFIGGVALDVTDRKRMEQQILQAQKMESVGTLAGGIAHDFNNLLGIIIGFTSLLADAGIENPQLAGYVQAIDQAAGRGAALVRQILTFARKSDASFGPLDLNQCIRDLAGLLAQTLPRIINLELDLTDPLPLVNADQGQIQQALLNLSLNARDAMPEGGRLCFSTSLAAEGPAGRRFSPAVPGPFIHIQVSDTGCGMTEEVRQRIFEPFFTTKPAGTGTGLGLAVVFGIIQIHRGLMEVQSTPGAGTVFSIYLPASQVSLSTLPPAPETVSGHPPGTETILLAEDEELIQKMLSAYLKRRGYQVISAMDGQEAVDLYRTHQSGIDLILTDFGMPKLTGGQIFRLIREMNPQARVIIASGYLDPDLRHTLLQEGVQAFLQKPYSLPELEVKIREVLSKA